VLLPTHATDGGGPRPLDPAVTASLRDLMRAVVTSGTGGALAGLAGEPAGKTGTAEFGEEVPPRTHAWFIGYRGDLAVAVLVEDGGGGGAVAAPLAAEFLQQVP
jgi:cell division protein FtsI/penicillin-binding protein 2